MDRAAEIWSSHSAHWGAFSARWNGTTLDVNPYAGDPSTSPMLQNFTTALRHKARIQGCCGQVTVVECEKYDGPLPAVRAFDPPEPVARLEAAELEQTS